MLSTTDQVSSINYHDMKSQASRDLAACLFVNTTSDGVEPEDADSDSRDIN